MNLLIVDDQPTNLKLLRAQLEAEGHAVFEAQDGVDALALLERQRVDVVISDVLMPRMDGYRLCHEIRKHARLHDLPVIIYTFTYTSPSDEKLALDVGADKYLKKPASVETITTALHEVIAQPHAAPRPDALREVEVLKQYNERLVSKLKEKNTELLAQTEALRLPNAAMTAAANAILITNRDGTIVWVNPAFTSLTGYTVAEAVGKNPRDLVQSGQEERAVYQNLWETVLSGRTWQGQLVNRRKDGSFYHEEQTITPVRDAHGEITHFIAIKQDLSERKHAEEALRASEERLREVVTRTRCVLWSGHVVGDAGWEEHPDDAHRFSWKISELAKPSAPVWQAARLPEDQPQADAVTIAALVSGADHYTVESRWRGLDGHIYWRHEEVSIQRVAHGRWNLFGVTTDDTERKQAEDVMRAVLTNAHCILWSSEVTGLPGWEQDVGNRQQKFQWLTQIQDEHAAQQVLPLEADDTTQYSQLFTRSHWVEDVWRMDEVSSRALIEGAPHYVNEFRCNDKFGQVRWMREDVTVRSLEPGRWEAFAVVTDITERKQVVEHLTRSEAQLAEAQKLAHIGSWQWDFQGSDSWWSDEMYRIYDVDPREFNPADADTSNLTHPDDREFAAAGFKRAMQERKPFEMEFRIIRPGGAIRTVFVQAVIVADASGQPVKMFGTTQDITERKQVEEALFSKTAETEAIAQQLWQAAKLATMGELAASIAHELNNPMATISLRVEGLVNQLEPDHPNRRSLEIVEQEIERMSALVANLLQFSRRSGTQVSTLDVREEIEKTLELIHYHLRRHRINVVREFADDAPMIQADRQQLRQLFLNLFTNASDAMPQGGTLTLRVSPVPANAGVARVRIEVSDSGSGIAPENLSQAFESFFTTKPEGKGTGLGLPICRRIVQAHHGTFDLTSEVGQGTTATITLPVRNGTNGTHLSQSGAEPGDLSQGEQT